MNNNLTMDFRTWLLEDESREVTAHYASSVSACRRKLYYDLTGEPKTEELTYCNHLKFEFGHSFELIFKKFLDDRIGKEVMGKVLAMYLEEEALRTEVPELKLPISMRVDYILCFEDGSTHGVELKSSFGRGIMNIEKSGKPKDEHMLQVLTYMNFGFDMPFSIFYGGRDNGYVQQFDIFQDEEGLRSVDPMTGYVHHYDTSKYNRAEIIKKLHGIEKALDEKKIPDRQFKTAIVGGEIKPKFTANKTDYKSDWQCSYCAFSSTCWKDTLSKSGKFYNGEKIV